MKVMEEITEWSKDRPLWQRDALRRMVVDGDLDDDDIRQLTEICKSRHGLAEAQTASPLTSAHMPDSSAGSGQISLLSIFHRRGVNALAENQTLKFHPNLTVVYGDNGAGKTGYIRILKGACRARGTEEILGNVVSGAAPPKPEVSIKYTKAGAARPLEWTGDESGDAIRRVSVFDTHSAAVYLREKTDVAFRPFGLDLFDKLVKACKAVKSHLEAEQRSLGRTALVAFEISENTAVSKLIAGLSSLTDPESVKALAKLSDTEKARLELLEKQLLDLQVNDPTKLAHQLSGRAERMRRLGQHLTTLQAALSEKAVGDASVAKKAVEAKGKVAKEVRDTTFKATHVTGTGSDHWAHMWTAAREFSQKTAYPGRSFPVTEEDAHCLLCQQELDAVARERLRQFEEFSVSTAETELRQAKAVLAQKIKFLTDLTVVNDVVDAGIENILIDSEAFAEGVASYLSALEDIRVSSLKALSETDSAPPARPQLSPVENEVRALAQQLSERAASLARGADPEKKRAIVAELQELKARAILGKHQDAVLGEIERKKRVAAYELCLNDTKTQAITAKSTSVTRAAVTEKLTKSFQQELASVGFKHIEVELQEAGGDQGNLYHKLVLKRAPGIDVPKVVSEGEARCLSIAAFFSELSTAYDPSGIVFDDPVSSLDYKWRQNVAKRLVLESKARQVIVFTHDVVFLLALQQFAKEYELPYLDQHVRQLSVGTGVCTEELPWVAMAVKIRIGHLKNECQAAEKVFRDGHQAAYEKEASYLYGLLREAWERGLEEVLLGGVVERFRPGVKTMHIGKIADIKDEDCKALDAGMTKCSRWLPGHDQSAAAKADIPEPAELLADIKALEDWVAAINKRRK